jgi:hypothetical protein
MRFSYELATDRLRSRAPCLDDGGERHTPALSEPVERLCQHERFECTHRILSASSPGTVGLSRVIGRSTTTKGFHEAAIHVP